MGLNYLGNDLLPNGERAYNFQDPNDGAKFSTVNPLMAFTLGAPTPEDEAKQAEFLNPAASIKAPSPMPDARLASNLAVPVTNPEYGHEQPVSEQPASDSQALTDAGIDVGALTSGRPQQRSGSKITNLDNPVSVQRESVSGATPPATGLTLETLGAQQPTPVADTPQTPARAPMPAVSDLVVDQPSVVNPQDLERRYSPGSAAGYEATGRTTKGIDPGDAGELRQLDDDLVQAQKDQQLAETLAKRDEAMLRSSEFAERDAALRQEQEEKQALALKQEAEKKALEDRINADEQAVAKKHPSMANVYKNGGTVAVAALFAGLGELGRGLTRSGSNTALEMINRAVDQSLNEQAAEIAGDKDAIAKRKNALAMYLADGHDPKYARLAAENLQLARERLALEDADVQKQLGRMGIDHQAAINGIAQEQLKRRTEMAKLKQIELDEKYRQARAGGLESEEAALDRAVRMAEKRAKLGELEGTRLTTGERAKVVEGRLAQGAAKEKPIATHITGNIDKAASNVLTYKRALASIAEAKGSGEDIELSPSGFRQAQPFTEFTQGEAAADKDRYGDAGARIVNTMKQVNSSVYNPVSGVQGEKEYARAIEQYLEAGDLAAAEKKLQERQAEAEQHLSNALQGLTEDERARVLKHADPQMRELYQNAFGGQRTVAFTPAGD